MDWGPRHSILIGSQVEVAESPAVVAYGMDLAGEPVAHVTGIIIIQEVGSITAEESKLLMAKEDELY